MMAIVSLWVRNCLGSTVACLWIFAYLPSCGETADETVTLTAPIRDSALVFTVDNPGPSDISVQMTLNGMLTMDMVSLAATIAAMPGEWPDEPSERKAWRFVMRHTVDLNPVSELPWLHDPLLMFWSVGFGQCDDLAAVLAHLWEAQGHKVNVWSLEGHVIPEVLSDGRWQMYDPSLGVYYLNRDSLVAGVEELMAYPELITAPLHRLQPQRSGQFLIHHARAYSRFVAAHYASAENNAVNPWFIAANIDQRISVHLPGGCRLEMPVGLPDTLSFMGLYGNRWLAQDFVRYTLTENWTGTLRMPFLPVMVRGRGLAVLGRDTFVIGEPALRERLTAFDRVHDSITLISTVGSPQIYCLLNGNIFVTGAQDVLDLTSQDAGKLRLTVSKGTAQPHGRNTNLEDHGVTELTRLLLRGYSQMPTVDLGTRPEERHRQSIMAMYEAAGMPHDGHDAALAYDSLIQQMGPQGQAYMFNLFEDSTHLALLAALLGRLPVREIASAAKLHTTKAAQRDNP